MLNGTGGGSFTNTGTIEAISGGALQFTGAVKSSGLVDVGAETLNVFGTGSYTQTGGTFRLSGGTVNSTSVLDFQSGIVNARGSITGSLNNGATLTPTLGGSGLNVTGNVTLLNASNLNFQLGGLTAGSQIAR